MRNKDFCYFNSFMAIFFKKASLALCVVFTENAHVPGAYKTRVF